MAWKIMTDMWQIMELIRKPMFWVGLLIGFIVMVFLKYYIDSINYLFW